MMNPQMNLKTPKSELLFFTKIFASVFITIFASVFL
jgi:hypothetical protein